MKKINRLLFLFIICSIHGMAQPNPTRTVQLKTKMPASFVDFDAYEALTKEVKEYRKNRLLSLTDFLAYAKDRNTIILDTRSAEMYKRKHVKGAINLNFSDFTQANLLRIIPSSNTRILIYCNNNFDDDPINFTTKVARPILKPAMQKKPLTLALNIPTFINLYGYGYKNVYELANLVSVFNQSMVFEGTDVSSIVIKTK